LDNYKIGEAVIVHFNIRGNEWKDNFYVNLDAWRLEKTKNDSETQTAKQKVDAAGASKKETENIPEGEDDLPF
jgi:hypothetical protein